MQQEFSKVAAVKFIFNRKDNYHGVSISNIYKCLLNEATQNNLGTVLTEVSRS